MGIRDRLNFETKELRPLAHRFVDAAYLFGRWLPPRACRQWYGHFWKWPAKRYQNLFQEFNAFSLAIEKDLMDRDTAIGELFGLDARKIDRTRAKVKARKAALEVGEAEEIIHTEIADELEVAKALSDDDAAGLRAPTKPTTRSDRRAARKR